MGTPSATEPWGWQFDGHHAVINYFVLGDQVVMSPHFAGSEPVTATSGKYKGTSVMQDEQDQGLAFVNALVAGRSARRPSCVRAKRPRTRTSAKPGRTTSSSTTPAFRANAMSTAQKEQLLDADRAVHRRHGRRACASEDGRGPRPLDRTWFAWIGRTEPGSVYYYRIHSPVILIEFDHQKPIGTRHLLRSEQSRPCSTSTRSCGRRTATTTARICCASTT